MDKVELLSVSGYITNLEVVFRKHPLSEGSTKCSSQLKRKNVIQLRVEDTKGSVPVPYQLISD